ncbi:MAG: PTS sugar transporter subunit IIA [Phycisphaerales bacterium]
MKILDILRPEAIKVPLEASDKRSAIHEMVELLASAGLIDRPADVEQAVWEREQQRTTGIGEGLAIPHGKTTGLDRLVMAIGRPTDPIDFQSMDRKPVQLIVLLISPNDRTHDHIQALGKISRMMSDATFRRTAYAAETSEELFTLLRDRDT